MHLKNFAMFHKESGLLLTPSYDQVAAIMYQYKQSALGVCGASNLIISNFKDKHVFCLGKEFGLEKEMVLHAVAELAKNLENAKEAVLASKVGTAMMKEKIIKIMEARWNEAFASIGKV